MSARIRLVIVLLILNWGLSTQALSQEGRNPPRDGDVVVAGIVRSPVAGDDLSKLRVVVKDETGRIISLASPAKSGGFVFPEPLAAGRYSVITWDSGAVICSQAVILDKNLEVIELDVGPAGAVKKDRQGEGRAIGVVGAVKSADGKKPLPGVIVKLEFAESTKRPAETAVTDTNGFFVIDSPLPRGKYKASIQDLSAILATSEIIVDDASRPQLCVLELRSASGSLKGNALRADGTPAIGAEVILFDELQQISYKTRADERGDYIFPVVVAGDFSLMIAATQRIGSTDFPVESHSTSIKIEDSQKTVDCRLRPRPGVSTKVNY